MRLDPFFSCLLLLTVCWSTFHFFSIKDRVQQRQQAKDFYPRSSNIVFWAGLVAAISLVIQGFGRRLIRPVAARMLPRDRWGVQVYALKQSRFAEMSMKAVYFLLLTGTAFFFLHEESWWPTLLGGSGGEAALFTDHPFQESHRFTHWYFYISAGYHLSCFLSLMLAPRLPDFFETLLLCVCGLLLIFFSYLGNFLRVGSIILFCHDFCDIFSCGCKVFVDTRHKVVTFCLFACLVVSWGYLRLYTFPVATLFPIFKNVKERKMTAENEGWGFFVFLLLTLLVMNIYWWGSTAVVVLGSARRQALCGAHIIVLDIIFTQFGLMLKMCLHFCTSGQMSDMHTPVPSAPEDQELQTAKHEESSTAARGSASRTSGGSGSRCGQRGGNNGSGSGLRKCADSSQGGCEGVWHWFGGRGVHREATEDRNTNIKEEQEVDSAANVADEYSRENNSSSSGSGSGSSNHTVGSTSPGSSNRSTARTAVSMTATTTSAADARKRVATTSSPSQQHQLPDATGDRRKSRERKKAACYADTDAGEIESELLGCSSRSTSNNIVETSARRKLLAKAQA